MNQVVHNTAWIPGHFHMTVGSAVALTLMGVAYWLVPYLTDRKLWGRKVAVAQAWIYTIGVLIFARGMISGGLLGMPRRTFMANAAYGSSEWELAGILMAVGGSLMTLGAALFFLVVIMTIFFGRRGEGPKDIPFAETVSGPASEGWELRLDDMLIWVGAAVVLIIIAYGPFLLSYPPLNMVSPGFRFF